MPGEVSIIITMVAIGVALATFMFTILRMQNKSFDNRFDEVKQHTDQRFDEINRRFDDVDRRFAEVNRRFEILESDIKQLRDDVSEVKGSLNTIHRGLRIEAGQPAE